MPAALSRPPPCVFGKPAAQTATRQPAFWCDACSLLTPFAPPDGRTRLKAVGVRLLALPKQHKRSSYSEHRAHVGPLH